jgi:hypothetical protein
MKRAPEGPVIERIWRRGRESNPSRRLCRPLHNLFATSPDLIVAFVGKPCCGLYQQKGKPGFPRMFWSGRRVSNSRPQPWQGCALPTELLPHGANFYCYSSKRWSGRRVSNSRPQPWQGCALPTELLPHLLHHDYLRKAAFSGQSFQPKSLQNWSGRRVSNSRPQPWQGCALPTELLPLRLTAVLLRSQQASIIEVLC